jgi:hypothetical protein
LAIDACADESRAWIGQARRAGIGDERDVLAASEALDQLRRARRFVVLVITEERLVDIVMS